MQAPSSGSKHEVSAAAMSHSAEVPHCQLCGSGERTLKFQDGPFRVVNCSQCGLVYVTPRLQGEAL